MSTDHFASVTERQPGEVKRYRLQVYDDSRPAVKEFVLSTEYDRLAAIIDEVHSWIVCACIATPEDMMEHAEHIATITAPGYKP